MFSHAKFPHRHNNDGSYDSFCTACFVTIASVRDEELLRAHELAHVCDPVNLCRIESLRSVSLWGLRRRHRMTQDASVGPSAACGA